MEKKLRCKKAVAPYIGCAMKIEHEDDIILIYLTAMLHEVKRVHLVKDPFLDTAEDARILDRSCSEITAYLNGRIVSATKGLSCADIKGD